MEFGNLGAAVVRWGFMLPFWRWVLVQPLWHLGVIVCATSQVQHMAELGDGEIEANVILNNSSKCPRKVQASFGAEAITLAS